MKIAQTRQGDTLANISANQEGPNVKKKTAKICYADAIARYHLPAAGLLILLLHLSLNCVSFWDKPKLSMSILTQSHQVFFGRPLSK